MKTWYILSFLFIVLSFYSCKQDAAQQETHDNAATPAAEPASNPPVDQQNSPAATGGHDNTFLTHKLFHIKGAYVSGQSAGEKPYHNHWFDLRPDGTYAYGIGKKQTYSGKWSYHEDSKTLSMTPDSKDEKASEWKVMHNEQMVVLVGTRTHGDNGTQLQLVWMDELPVD
jgi:hypothetical protein